MPVTMLKKTAADVMSSPPFVVGLNAALKDAAGLMLKRNLGCVPVVDDEGRYAGMITERTFQAQLAGVKPESAYSADQRVLSELLVDGLEWISSARRRFAEVHSVPVSKVMRVGGPTVSRDAALWEISEKLLTAPNADVAADAALFDRLGLRPMEVEA